MANEERKAQLSFGVDASGVKQGMAEIKRDVREMAQDVQQSGQQAAKGIQAIGDGAPAAAQKMDGATKSIIGSIERATAAIQAGEKGSASYFESLAKQRNANVDVLKPYIDQLRQAEEAQRVASGSLNKMGVSAAQTAAALRGVPAQFTDIIVSLQGGQAPLTVFLQQGGQLKDMFGGAGNAARALGGYVLGLVNPLNVAAAAAGVLAVAYNQGSKEAQAYGNALILTGNAAGTTSGQLKAYAQDISGVVGTQGKAAESLIALAGTGKVVGDVLRDAGLAAVQYERATGQAVSKTADQFADLRNEPLAGVLKLNDGLNFLTESTYRQIKSLEEQGRTTDAARVAQQAYADALIGRAGEIDRNLGSLERGWRAVADAAKRGWDNMLGVGRAQTTQDRLKQVREEIAAVEKQMGSGKGFASTEGGAAFGTGRGGLNPAAQKQMQDRLAALGAEAAALEGVAAGQKAAADAEAERAQNRKAYFEWEKQGDAFQSKAAKRQEEIRKAEVEGRSLIAAGLITEADLRERISDITEKYKEQSSKAGESEVATIRAKIKEEEAYIARLRERGAEASKLTEGEKLVAKLQEELTGKLDARTRAAKQLALAEAERLATLQKSRMEEERSIKNQQESEAAYRKLLDSIYKGADATNKQAEAQEAANASFGKSKTAIAEMNLEQMKLSRDMAKDAGPWTPEHLAAMDAAIDAQERWVRSLQAGDLKTINAHTDELLRSAQEQAKLYEDEGKLAGLTRLEREKIVALRQVELKYAKELEKIEKSGLSDEDKADQRGKVERAKRIEGEAAVSKVIQQDWDRTAEEINKSLTDALLRGFESGKGFAENLRDTLKNMFNTLVLRPIISAILAPVSGVISGVTNGLFGGGSGGSPLGMASNAYSTYNTGSQLYTIGSQYIGGSMSGANALGTMWGNATGTGIDGLLATNGAYGTAGGAGGAGAGGMSALAGAGAFLAIAAVVANMFGAFASRQMVGGGLRGTLGGDDLSAYQLWRTGGTLIGGPSYDIKDPGKDLADSERELQTLRESGQAASRRAVVLQDRISYIKDRYGDQIAQGKKQSDVIQQAYDVMRTGVGNMADVLGIDSKAVRAYKMPVGTDSIDDSGGLGISFAGLDADGISKKVQEALATANNALAEQVIGKWETYVETIRHTFEVRLPSQGDNTLNDPGEYREDVETVTRTRYVASEFAREGENAIATLTRLAGSLSTVNGVFETLGTTLYQSSLAGGDMASKLIDVFGNADSFVAATGEYFQRFYSPEEQRAAARKQIEKQLGTLDLKLPDIDATDARAQYRKLVEAQDLTTESGRKAYAMLVQLAPAFDAVAAAGQDATRRQEEVAGKRFDLEQRLLIAQGKDREALALRRNQEVDALAKLDPELAKLVRRIYELEDAASLTAQFRQDRETAYGKLQNAITLENERLNAQLDAIDAQRTALGEQRTLADESLSLITGVFDLVRSNARELYGQVESTAAMQAAQGWAFVEQALATARGTGYLPEQTQLQEAIGAARGGLDSKGYATQFEQDRDRLVLAGMLSGLEDISGRQKTAAEQQIAAIEAQAKSLDAQTEGINKQLKAQQEMLTYWRRQIDIANGTFDATASIAEAVKQIAGAVNSGVYETKPEKLGSSAAWGGSSGGAGAGATPPAETKYRRVTSLGTSIGYTPVIDQALIERLDKLSPLYHTFDGTGDLLGLLTAIKGAGGTLDDLSILSGYFHSDWVKAAASVGVPAFAVGTNYVPYDTPAIVHKGERIIPAADNRALMAAIDAGQQGGRSERLETLVAQLVAENRQQAGEILRLNARIAKVLERWDGDGTPPQREEQTA